jgi:hypothetical protein
MLVETGVDYQHQVFYPASGLTGNLWRIGTLGLSFGVSPSSRSFDGGVHNHLSITKFERAASSMLTVPAIPRATSRTSPSGKSGS